jgi:hypothetical protein
MKTLSERVQRIFSEHPELDQAALGRIAGVTKGTVNQWLDGKIKSMKMSYATCIEKELGYRTAWLVMGDGEPKGRDKPSLSPEASVLIECIERLDGLGARARKSFVLHAGLFLLSFPEHHVEDAKAEHDLLDLAEREVMELVPRQRQGPVEEKNAGSK